MHDAFQVTKRDVFKKKFPTDNDAIGEDEERDIWGKCTQHQTPRHHYTTEHGYRPGTKIFHTGTAHWTCTERDTETFY